MFARIMLQSTRRAALLNVRWSSPILQTATIPQPLFFSTKPQLLRRDWQTPQPRSRYTREDIENAKPLVTSEDFKSFVQSPQTRWVALLLGSGAIIFYYSNLEKVPVSGRQRFNCYSDRRVEAEALMDYNALMRQLEGAILPAWDPRSKMVARVMKRLIPASGFTDADWEVHVVHSPSELPLYPHISTQKY